MLGYQINSPFTSLSGSLFSPASTARASAGQVNAISAAADPLMRLRSQQNRGVSANLFDAMSGAGAASAARQAAPVAQGLEDAVKNAEWGLNAGLANERFANNAFGMLGQQSLNNQRYGLQSLGLMSNLFGGLFQ